MLCTQDEAVEETGWKLVHGDVFRPPAHPTLLVASLGSGIQIFSMVLIVIGQCVCGHVLCRYCICGCVLCVYVCVLYMCVVGVGMCYACIDVYCVFGMLSVHVCCVWVTCRCVVPYPLLLHKLIFLSKYLQCLECCLLPTVVLS